MAQPNPTIPNIIRKPVLAGRRGQTHRPTSKRADVSNFSPPKTNEEKPSPSEEKNMSTSVPEREPSTRQTERSVTNSEEVKTPSPTKNGSPLKSALHSPGRQRSPPKTVAFANPLEEKQAPLISELSARLAARGRVEAPATALRETRRVPAPEIKPPTTTSPPSPPTVFRSNRSPPPPLETVRKSSKFPPPSVAPAREVRVFPEPMVPEEPLVRPRETIPERKESPPPVRTRGALSLNRSSEIGLPLKREELSSEKKELPSSRREFPPIRNREVVTNRLIPEVTEPSPVSEVKLPSPPRMVEATIPVRRTAIRAGSPVRPPPSQPPIRETRVLAPPVMGSPYRGPRSTERATSPIKAPGGRRIASTNTEENTRLGRGIESSRGVGREITSNRGVESSRGIDSNRGVESSRGVGREITSNRGVESSRGVGREITSNRGVESSRGVGREIISTRGVENISPVNTGRGVGREITSTRAVENIAPVNMGRGVGREITSTRAVENIIPVSAGEENTRLISLNLRPSPHRLATPRGRPNSRSPPRSQREPEQEQRVPSPQREAKTPRTRSPSKRNPIGRSSSPVRERQSVPGRGSPTFREVSSQRESLSSRGVGREISPTISREVLPTNRESLPTRGVGREISPNANREVLSSRGVGREVLPSSRESLPTRGVGREVLPSSRESLPTTRGVGREVLPTRGVGREVLPERQREVLPTRGREIPSTRGRSTSARTQRGTPRGRGNKVPASEVPSSQEPWEGVLTHQEIQNELKEMEAYYRAAESHTKGATGRAIAFREGAKAFQNYSGPIDYDTLVTVQHIGPKIATEIVKLYNTGKSSRLEELASENPELAAEFEDPEMSRATKLFETVKGIGEATAKKLYKDGYRTIEDLQLGIGRSKPYRLPELTAAAQLGLDNYFDLLTPIPREDIDDWKEVFTNMFKCTENLSNPINDEFRWMLVGSYRRGRDFSTDIDLVVMNISPREVFDMLQEYKVGEFSRGPTNMRGLIQLDELHQVCQLDITNFRESEWIFGVLHSTGSSDFNQLMQDRARDLGYFRLNTYGLFATENDYKRNVSIAVNSEEDIFNLLEVQYLSPAERPKEIKTLPLVDGSSFPHSKVRPASGRGRAVVSREVSPPTREEIPPRQGREEIPLRQNRGVPTREVSPPTRQEIPTRRGREVSPLTQAREASPPPIRNRQQVPSRPVSVRQVVETREIPLRQQVPTRQVVETRQQVPTRQVVETRQQVSARQVVETRPVPTREVTSRQEVSQLERAERKSSPEKELPSSPIPYLEIIKRQAAFGRYVPLEPEVATQQPVRSSPERRPPSPERRPPSPERRPPSPERGRASVPKKKLPPKADSPPRRPSYVRTTSQLDVPRKFISPTKPATGKYVPKRSIIDTEPFCKSFKTNIRAISLKTLQNDPHVNSEILQDELILKSNICWMTADNIREILAVGGAVANFNDGERKCSPESRNGITLRKFLTKALLDNQLLYIFVDQCDNKEELLGQDHYFSAIGENQEVILIEWGGENKHLMEVWDRQVFIEYMEEVMLGKAPGRFDNILMPRFVSITSYKRKLFTEQSIREYLNKTK
jgi:DNA polymerase/3'-5' exonuclease PolX